MWQCAPARGLSRLTCLACPRHPQVDPDEWLTTLDYQGFLRRVGRDGCVDVDLQTYYISSHLAGRQVFLQVEASERHFVAWHADQVVTVLPIKGLMKQEMGIDDYLIHMKQEALAHARRSIPHVPWNLRQLPLW